MDARAQKADATKSRTERHSHHTYEVRIRASARADRGLIAQRQSSGYLWRRRVQRGRAGQRRTRCTHDRKPSFIFGSMRMGRPVASGGGVISKTCSTRAMLRNSAASAKYRPGHILRQARRPRENVCVPPHPHKAAMGRHAHLLPKPNATVAGSLTSGFSRPSLRNRSGRKLSGSGYSSALCRMALENCNAPEA